MKKLLFMPMAAAVACLFSCKNEQTASVPGPTGAAAKNLEAMHVITSAFDSGDTSRINDVVSTDFRDHAEPQAKNRDSLKAMIVAWKADSKDSKTEVIREVADDEYVFSWLRFTGTSSGTAPGMPAGPYNMTSIEVVKFKDGLATEHWSFMEPAEMMKYMPASGTDTTKKQ
jgi:predicted SnoaL-like aldol condensation-catalyzing enzyme